MKIEANTPEEYIAQLPEDRKSVMIALRETIQKNLPAGFEETMNYGMIGFVVPHSIYPAGYHVDPKLPLPFINIASQKNFIALYHMGIYANADLLDWFTAEYPKYMKTKLDMGKSCIRFKKPNDLPLDLIGELCTKMNVQQWVDIYNSNLPK